MVVFRTGSSVFIASETHCMKNALLDVALLLAAFTLRSCEFRNLFQPLLALCLPANRLP